MAATRTPADRLLSEQRGALKREDIERYMRNLNRAYEMAGPNVVLAGARWYRTSRGWINSLVDVFPRYDVQTVAAIIAVTSPQVAWDSQKDAIPYFLAHRSGPRPGFGANWKKATRLRRYGYDAKLVTGPKVRAFFKNLCGDFSKVTLDRHAIRIARLARPESMGKNHRWVWKDKEPTDKEKRAMRAAYRGLAGRKGYQPAELQAGLWTWWRRHWADEAKKQRSKK